jgi:hypothetical protein
MAWATSRVIRGWASERSSWIRRPGSNAPSKVRSGLFAEGGFFWARAMEILFTSYTQDVEVVIAMNHNILWFVKFLFDPFEGLLRLGFGIGHLENLQQTIT